MDEESSRGLSRKIADDDLVAVDQELERLHDHVAHEEREFEESERVPINGRLEKFALTSAVGTDRAQSRGGRWCRWIQRERSLRRDEYHLGSLRNPFCPSHDFLSWQPARLTGDARNEDLRVYSKENLISARPPARIQRQRSEHGALCRTRLLGDIEVPSGCIA